MLLYGDDFDPAADVSITSDVDFAEGANVVLTLARAGFDSALTIRASSTSATIDLPQGDPASTDSVPRIVQLWLTKSGWTVVSVHFAIDPPFIGGGAPRMAVFSNEALPPTSSSSCAPAVSVANPTSICRAPTTCDVVLIGGPRKFGEAVEMLAKVAPRSKPYAGVSFLVDPPCDPSDSAISKSR